MVYVHGCYIKEVGEPCVSRSLIPNKSNNDLLIAVGNELSQKELNKN